MTSHQTQVIYHIAPRATWEAQQAQSAFTVASLRTEGFIHCTAEPEMLLQVANRFYRDTLGPFIIVCIVPDRLHAEVRWEMADGHLFPHIYGVVNRDAVECVLPFPRHVNHSFMLPPELKV